ncbi:SDR family NAD(P)-dependent oxidoreductase [Pedobacter alluvionis]|uniref:NAD(P)-dependent dehydrogenase (Short-subunit alcohol dehydrogenase family) n=1 Tax=Pedobacter alluvionis TaxID=475253 RepID=A0A497Y8M6_9SPHI|nr:SDR family oxidoreductase [Pedobacter alluvionis]RLJ79952.1 NAD(P)-dependent dehydrogenase (short-subunit alcohol dehydrogenase family) [Pedobacter alluvionis]TFB31256.1 SDR family oxidoreductase [Pedobacter alluvionis]
METQNKIALVTGGSRGLGKNAALKIAAKGISVIVTYQSKKEEAEDTVNEIKALGVPAAAIQLNVGDSKTFDAFFTEVKTVLKSVFNAEKFDFLINNAGIGIHASFADTTEEQFDALVNIHYKGAFFLTQKALPLLNDGSGIINVSSGLARFATPGYAAYASMKGAMETLTKYQAKELGARGIRSNIIAPGAIETDFGGGVVRDNDQLNAGIAANTALGRVGLPDDIGGVVAFLCTEDARWINAQRIEASGGMFL